jgi:hypothetical protein
MLLIPHFLHPISVPPEMIKGPEDKEGVENQEYSLTCEASGHPPPKYEFYKAGSHLGSFCYLFV